MENKIFLDQWTAFELFCRCIEKFESGVNLSDFNHQLFTNKKLKYYSNKEKSVEINTAIFGYKVDPQKLKHKKSEKENVNTLNAKSQFFELSKKLKLGEAVSLDEDKFNIYREYIGIDIPYKKIEQIKISSKQVLLENTIWWVYSHSSFEKEINNELKRFNGVTRDILYFKDFRKAMLNTIKPEENGEKQKVDYFGVFRVCNQKGDTDPEGFYLKLEMKTDNNEKDLSIILYIGTGEPELALGIFRNLGSRGGTMYCGTVMIDQYQITKKTKLKPGFFDFQDVEKLKSIPEYVLKYFQDKKKNKIRVPAKMTNQSAFDKWHATQVSRARKVLSSGSTHRNPSKADLSAAS